MEENKDKSVPKWVSGAVTVLLVLVIVLCLFIVVQLLNNGYVNIGGFIMFRVVTGSMEPTIPTGSLLVTQQVDISSIGIQDIICFKSQNPMIYGSVVTHRVVDVLTGSDGNLLLQTKGDANVVADGYFVTQDNFLGKVIWYSGDGSVLASVFSFLTDKVGFLGCIVFPCLILATLILRGCVKNIQEELNRAREEAQLQEQPDEEHLLSSMTAEQYQEMIDRIRAELVQELSLGTPSHEGEHYVGTLEGDPPETDKTE